MGDNKPLSMWEAIGYHTTHTSNLDNILRNGFKMGDNGNNTWLGAGVYFWANLKDANIWAKIRFKSRDTAIITAKIRTQRCYLLDLTDPAGIYLYEQMYRELIKAQRRGSASFEDCHDLDRTIIEALSLKHKWKVIRFADNWNESSVYMHNRKRFRSYVLDQNTRRRVIICVRDLACIAGMSIVDGVASDETAAAQDAGSH